MTFKLAITGKGGSGKTTIVKSFFRIFRELYPEKSILLFDNDLSGELGHSFGLDVRNTIYGIRSGKHEYKTGIPENMSKQEYVEWALEDILVPIEENTDLIVSWFVGSKDCRCPITGQLNYALKKLINRYDIVIFDCEFDLKYLNQLVDTDVDSTLIVATPAEDSVNLARRIQEFSEKYSAGNQLSVVLNKAENDDRETLYNMLNLYELKVLGVIPFDKELLKNPSARDSEVVKDAIRNFYSRINIPQGKLG